MGSLKEKPHVSFYKELYEREVDRVNDVSKRFQWSISIWVLLFGGIVYVFNKYEGMTSVVNGVYVTLSISAAFILISMSLILWGLYSTKIKHTPPASVYKKRYIKIKEYFESLDSKVYKIDQNTIEEKFERTLEENYISTTDDIMENNEKRIRFSFYANINMGLSGFFLLITFIKILFNLVR